MRLGKGFPLFYLTPWNFGVPEAPTDGSTYGRKNGAWAAIVAGGDVTGPASNTDGYIPLWDGADSKTLKNGLAVPAGGLAGLTALGTKQDALGFTPENVSNKSTDGALGTSDTLYPSQKAVKTYADQLIAAANAVVYKGVIDCSANPNYPAADAGHLYKISVAGKIGGASGVAVEVGDVALCTTDGTVSGDQATVGSYWDVIQKNIDGAVIGPASSTDKGIVSFDGVTGKLIQSNSLKINNGVLYPTSDSTTAIQLNKADGTTNVLNIDTTNGRVGIGTTSPASLLQINGTPGTVAAGLTLGDGDSGLMETADDILALAIAGNINGYRFNSAGFKSTAAYGENGFNIILGSASATAPVYSFGTDTNTGIGHVDSDVLSLITNGQSRIYIDSTGNVGIGTTGPTAYLHLKAGTATAGTAPLKLTAGTNLGTTEAGAIEYDGTHLYFSAANGGTRYQLDQQSVSLADGSVTLAKMANLAQNTIIGRVTASTGVPEALTAANVRTIINVADGATANAKATGAELDTGTDDVKFATAKALADSAYAKTTDITATKLDDLSAPDDNTDLNVSATAHGLCPKFPNNTTTFLRGDGTYAAAGGFTSKARAYLNTTHQTIGTGSATKVAFNAETYDTNNEFDSTTNRRFTAAAAGVYQVNAQVYWEAGTDQGFYSMYIRVNNAAVTQSTVTPSGTGEFSIRCSEILNLNQNDYVEVFVFQGSGSDKYLAPYSEQTFISIARIQ